MKRFRPGKKEDEEEKSSVSSQTIFGFICAVIFGKSKALVNDILLPTIAITDYATGLETLSANGFFKDFFFATSPQ